jgi:predicted nucleic acid-binding protein
MKASVYIDTSVVSYLTARRSKDVTVAGRQLSTHRWWSNQRRNFELFSSRAVILEASAGDKNYAAKRVRVLRNLNNLLITGAATDLADLLVQKHSVPAIAAPDALHIALCAVYSMDFLLTWNFAHMANAHLRSKVELVCRMVGYRPAVICTPDELV